MLGVAALIAGATLTPATGATGPYINYLSYPGVQNIYAAAPDGSNPQPLVPPGVTVYYYDVTTDGSGLLTWSTWGLMGVAWTFVAAQTVYLVMLLIKKAQEKQTPSSQEGGPEHQPAGTHPGKLLRRT